MQEQRFFEDIKKFNDIYKLPNHDRPHCGEAKRLIDFKDILSEEVEEVDEIIEKMNSISSEQDKLEAMTDLADWLGDIVVYCASEARRWGIPLAKVLEVIMDSNFSKLGSDGQPIYDERGKVMKGPGYWKPEPKIKEILGELQ